MTDDTDVENQKFVMSDDQDAKEKKEGSGYAALGEFTGNHTALDGLNLSNLKVHQNKFTYAGGPLPILNGSIFVHNEVSFIGPAGNAMKFLVTLVHQTEAEDRTMLLRSFHLLRPDQEVRNVKDE